MNDFIFLFGLFTSMGLNGFFLTVRKKEWCTNYLRFGLTGLLFFMGLAALLLFDNPSKYQRSSFIWLMIPLVHSLIDRFFKYVSLKLHNRDLLLYMRGSEDLNLGYKNQNLKTSDYLFSIILVILLFILPLLGI
jgi:hypothetical protein